MAGKKSKHGHKKAGKHHGGGKHAQPKIKRAHAHVVAKHPTHVTASPGQGGF